MKSSIVKVVLLGGVITVMFACNAKKAEPEAAAIDKEQIKKEIQGKEDEFANLYNGAELKEIGYYADDATNFYQHRAPLVGKAAILEFLKSDVDSNSNKITFVTNEVFPSSDGNQVVEVGSYKVTDSAKSAINTGNYITLFEKRNGKYVSVREMSASDVPLQ